MAGMTPLGRGHEASDGFILPLTLAALALMALSLWAAVAAFDLATRNVRAIRESIAFDVAAATIEGRLLFIAGTEPLGPAGFRIAGPRISRAQMLGMEGLTEAQMSRGLPQYLRLDGRRYQTPRGKADTDRDLSASIYVTLQDRAGLVNLNLPDEPVITRSLEQVGVDQSTAPIMAAVLADYIDTDDLTRIDGAEREFYSRQGRPPPLNRDLRSATQAFDAFGWQALTEKQRNSLLEFAYAGPLSIQKNVNTAPEKALQAWLGIDASTAHRIVTVRESNPFFTAEEISSGVGIVLPENEFSAYVSPAPAIRVRIIQLAPICRMREFWISIPAETSSRPLFFGGGEGMTCGAVDLESSGSDGIATPFPDTELLVPAGEG